jgi:DNA-binding MarR family transcriptional regulator
MFRKDYSQKFIAGAIGVTAANVSRELKKLEMNRESCC